MAQPAAQKKPLRHGAIWGKTKLRSPSHMGDVTDTSEVGSPSKRKHHLRYSTWLPTRTSTTRTKTDLQKQYL